MSQKLLEAVRMPARIAEPRDELQEAFENYRQLKIEHARVVQENLDLRVENGALVAEVNMIREAHERAETDRVRLQAIASTFVGGIRGLNAVAADLYSLAIKHGLEAVDAIKPEEKTEMDQAGTEIRDIIERVAPVPPKVEM